MPSPVWSDARSLGAAGAMMALLSAGRPAAAQPVEPGAPAPSLSAPLPLTPPPPAPPGDAAPATTAAPVAPTTAVTPPPAAEPAPTPPAAVIKAAPEVKPDPGFALHVGGGAIIWAYLPFLDAYKNDLQLSYVSLRLKATFDQFGLFVHARIRDRKLAPYFDGPAWIEEAYAWVDLGSAAAPLKLKLGKVHAPIGLDWDNSFYGNIQMFDGMKLTPEHGFSLEGRFGAEDRGGVRYTAQFLPVDGRTNFSPQDRDTISIPGARRRYQSILRAEPFVQLGETSVLKVGLTGEYLQADLPEPVGPQDVFRGAVDATLWLGSFGLWGEFLYQSGQTVLDFPYAAQPATETSPAVPGRASSHNYYVLAGAEYTYQRFVARYNFSYGLYDDQSVSEWIHEPGLGVKLNDHLDLLAEYVLWPRHTREGDTEIDNALAISLSGTFSALVAGKE